MTSGAASVSVGFLPVRNACLPKLVRSWFPSSLAERVEEDKAEVLLDEVLAS